MLKYRRRAVVLIFLLALCSVVSGAQAGLIFKPGTTTFAASHASTVVELKDGRLLAAWFGGTAEGAKDVAIWSARQTAEGWSEPVEVVREPTVPCWKSGSVPYQ